MSVIEHVIAALTAHDLDAFVACYAEDAKIEEGNDGAVLAHGHEAMRVRYGALLAEHPKARWTVLHRIEAGEFVVQHEEVHGMGIAVVQHVCVYLVRDGLIHQERVLR
ncbi:MAG TPA: nuclear transport factor 2 family protein [Gaiellaceae bacterium]|jgi:hypothetical protein